MCTWKYPLSCTISKSPFPRNPHKTRRIADMAVHRFFVYSPNTEEANQKLLEVFQDLAQEQGAGQCIPPIMQPKGLYFHDCVLQLPLLVCSSSLAES